MARGWVGGDLWGGCFLEGGGREGGRWCRCRLEMGGVQVLYMSVCFNAIAYGGPHPVGPQCRSQDMAAISNICISPSHTILPVPTAYGVELLVVTGTPFALSSLLPAVTECPSALCGALSPCSSRALSVCTGLVPPLLL